MEYRKLGNTDIDVSVVSTGCWAFAGGPTWGAQDDADSIATVDAALEVGVNFFDTAEGYGAGESEEILGRALKGRRDKAIIATKASPNHHSTAGLKEACEASLRRLQTDYIDVYQLHWPNRDVPFAETMAALEALRDEGKIRAISMSNFGVKDMPDMLQYGRFESNQIPYNMLWRAIEFNIQQQCVENNISILPYSALAQGLLTGKFATADDVPEGRARTRHYASTRGQVRHGEAGQEAETFAAIERIRQISAGINAPMTEVAAAWLLAQPGVTSIIAGARSPEQMKQNALAAELSLSADVIAELNAATETLKQAFGPNPDMWQPEENSRYR